MNRHVHFPLPFVLGALFVGCNNPIPANLPNGPTLPVLTGSNVLQMTVNGSECSSGSYTNKPCVSVTVCEPGSSNCQTIGDILVDTGSFGLRIFKSAVGGLSFPGISSGSGGAGSLAECVQFGDGSSDWGPVVSADIGLGAESHVTVPIHLIDSTYFAGAFSCGSPDATPAQAGFNGILGVGLFAEDCGSKCVSNAGNGLYFSCQGAKCSGTSAPLADQVRNPISALPVDNNGVILELPSVPAGGQASADGYLVLGIGTESNNKPSGVNAFTADSTGEFQTSFNSQNDKSFLDSGSNAYFFPSGSPALFPDCGTNQVAYLGWFCPASASTQTATNLPASGSTSSLVTFEIENAIALLNGPNHVFNDIGATSGSGALSGYFDWGMPFYLGRNVVVGLEGTASSLGTGPYWAY